VLVRIDTPSRSITVMEAYRTATTVDALTLSALAEILVQRQNLPCAYTNKNIPSSSVYAAVWREESISRHSPWFSAKVPTCPHCTSPFIKMIKSRGGGDLHCSPKRTYFIIPLLSKTAKVISTSSLQRVVFRCRVSLVASGLALLQLDFGTETTIAVLLLSWQCRWSSC